MLSDSASGRYTGWLLESSVEAMKCEINKLFTQLAIAQGRGSLPQGMP